MGTTMFEIQHQQFKSARYWLTRRAQIDMSPPISTEGRIVEAGGPASAH